MLFRRPNVEKLEERKDVKRLIRALTYRPDPCCRVDAARALGRIGDSQAVKALIKALGDWGVCDHPGIVSDCVCWSAAVALGGIGDIAAVSPLIEILKDKNATHKNATLRGYAALALGEIGSTQAIEHLIALLNDDSTCGPLGGFPVSCMAIRALGEIGNASAVKPLISMFKGEFGGRWRSDEDIIEAIKKIGGTVASNGLCELLDEGYISIRDFSSFFEKVVVALGDIGDASSITPLISMFKDDHPDYVIDAVIEALRKIGSANVIIDALTTFLNDYPNENTVQNQKRKDQVMTALSQFKASEIRESRKAEIDKLQILGSHQAVEELKLLLYKYSEEGAWDLQKDILQALGNIGQCAVPTIINALCDNSVRVSSSAGEILESIEWQPSNDKEKLIYLLVKRNWDEIISIGSPAVDFLIAIMKREYEFFYNYLDISQVAKVLGKIGDSRAVEPILAEFKKRYVQNINFVEAIIDLNDPLAIQHAIKSWINNLNEYRCSPDEEEGLAKFGAPAIKPLVIALANAKKHNQKAIGRILRRITGKDYGRSRIKWQAWLKQNNDRVV